MSHVATLLVGLVLLPSVLQGNRTGDVLQLDVTVILRMESDVPAGIVTAMKNEVVRIYAATPYHFQWKSVASVREGESFDDLSVIRLTGTCAVAPMPLYDERGPLGLTHVTEGRVLPFISLDCDRVRMVLQGNLDDKDTSATSQFIFGRALGRVLAHEMYHVLARTRKHGKMGVTKGAFSALELMAPEMKMDAASLQLLEAASLIRTNSNASQNGF